LSSHREAPEISKDASADNTDVYAFVSPDAPNTVTLIANFIPFQIPDGGPNFNEFADDVLYEIHVSNAGTAQSDISYQFRFTTHVRNPNTFLYNTGPITKLTDTTFNRYQTYTVTKVVRGGATTVIAPDLIAPPVRVGIRSTPNYAALAKQGIYAAGAGRKVFAGQRAEGFYVDLGSIFDLGALRPFQHLHLIPSADAMGVNGTQELNVHTLAIQVPKRELSRTGTNPTDPSKPEAVIGVYASASRQTGTMFDQASGTFKATGPFQQVSRLAMPLVNEVLISMGQKDYWNSQAPAGDAQFVSHFNRPEFSDLLPALYPGVFPNLAAYTKNRADIVAIFLTGLPAGVVAGFQNYTGPTQAEMTRLNMAIPPSSNPNVLGLIGGDLAGFPNGRRVFDDVVTVELRALAGATIPLVDPSFTPDGAASAVRDGTSNTNGAYQANFPYLADPNSGYDFRPGTPVVSAGA